MHVVTRVEANPGGRVTLRFGPDRYRIEPRDGLFDWLMSDRTVIGALAGAVAFGFGGVKLYDAGLAVLAAVSATIAVVFATVVVIRLVVEILGELLGYAVLAIVILLLPLLVFPGVRHWARQRWNSDKPTLHRNVVLASSVSHALVLPDTATTSAGTTSVVVTVLDGRTMRYTASGESGERLKQGFQTLLGDRTTVSTYPKTWL